MNIFSLLLLSTLTVRYPQNQIAPQSHSGMVLIPAGTFQMGSSHAMFQDAHPIHKVQLSAFWMDSTPVTNADYAKFVAATKYKTVAERPLNPKDFPGVPKEKLVPGALVFKSPPKPVALDDVSQWWEYVPGANWKHPEGPKSSIANRMDHPVVHPEKINPFLKSLIDPFITL